MRHHISLEVRLFEFIMMLEAKPLTDGRGSGAAPPGSGVQGAVAPGKVQGAKPLTGVELRLFMKLTDVSVHLVKY